MFNVWADATDASDYESGIDTAARRTGTANFLTPYKPCLPPGNPYLYNKPGFSPFHQWGRRKRGRPSMIESLLPVSQQADAIITPKVHTRPPGVEVKRYLDELKEFCLDDFLKPAKKGKKARRKLAFDCPKGRDFDPPSEQPQFGKAGFDINEDCFRPCLFDFVQMETKWKEPVIIADEYNLPKAKLGRPRKYPVKEKVPGRPRGRPRKIQGPEISGRIKGQTEKKAEEDKKPRFIFTFDDRDADENEIQDMISSGLLVINASDKKVGRPRIHPPKEKVPGRPLGRPRIYPVKEKVPGRPLGRPRIYPVKVKVPGRPRGRPRIYPMKIKVPGRKRGRPRKEGTQEAVPKVKRPRGRPRKVDQVKPKVIFTIENGTEVNPEEIKKLKKEGVKVVDLNKKRGRKKKQLVPPTDENGPVTDALQGIAEVSDLILHAEHFMIGTALPSENAVVQEKKKRGRKKKVVSETDEAGLPKEPKKRGRKKKIVSETDEAALPKEPKKRGRKKKIVPEISSDGQIASGEQELVLVKKRGRKRKLDTNGSAEPQVGGLEKVPKKRGRKKKQAVVEQEGNLEGEETTPEKLLVKIGLMWKKNKLDEEKKGQENVF